MGVAVGARSLCGPGEGRRRSWTCSGAAEGRCGSLGSSSRGCVAVVEMSVGCRLRLYCASARVDVGRCLLCERKDACGAPSPLRAQTLSVGRRLLCERKVVCGAPFTVRAQVGVGSCGRVALKEFIVPQQRPRGGFAGCRDGLKLKSKTCAPRACD